MGVLCSSSPEFHFDEKGNKNALRRRLAGAAPPSFPPAPLAHRDAHIVVRVQNLGVSSPLLPDRLPKDVNVKPTGCLTDANANQNKCGEGASATCVGSHGLGECCGKAGWCGAGPDYCGDGVQANYSHGKGLCAEYGGNCASGISLEQLISVRPAYD